MKKIRGTCSISEEIVLYEILPWVPLKPLLRFKLVSKEWCRVISQDPIFKSSHIQRSFTTPTRPPGGLLYYGDEKLPYFLDGGYHFLPTTIGLGEFASMPDESLKYLDFCRDGHLRASSNGLLCCSCTCWSPSPPDCFYVTNPVTREVISIPNPNGFKDVAIAFEPLASNPFFLLVSRLIPPGGPFAVTNVGFAVYSSKTGLWITSRAIAEFPGQTGIGVRLSPIYCGGKLFWRQGLTTLLWFDAEKETAGVVDIPVSSGQIFKSLSKIRGEIGDCRGTLTYTHITTEFVNIWFLTPNDTAWTWTYKYCLNIREIIHHNIQEIPSYYQTMLSDICQGHCRPLPYDGGDLVMFCVKEVQGIGNQVILSCNLKTRFMHLILHSGIFKFKYTVLYPYTSTFASVPIPPKLNLCRRVSCRI